jgi:hypothetical protein
MDNKLYEWYALIFIYIDGSWEYVNVCDCSKFKTFDEANEERIYLQPEYEERIEIIKETRQLIG